MSILDLAKQGESSLLVGSKRKVGTETLWSGQFHRTREHIAWARNCIGSSSCSSRSSNLDGYHNKCQLRHGDMVDVKDPNKIECGKLRKKMLGIPSKRRSYHTSMWGQMVPEAKWNSVWEGLTDGQCCCLLQLTSTVMYRMMSWI